MYFNSLTLFVSFFLCQNLKRSNYGINPEVEDDRRKAIEEKIESKKQKLAQETTFSNVKTLSRHAMEVEKSLNRGTEKSNAFSHLLHFQQKCKKNTCVFVCAI